MKRPIALALCLAFAICLALTGCGKKTSETTDAVLSQFEEFTQIPRPSTHEEQISNYLKAWAEKRGFAVVQDDHFNIVIDVPAMQGYENLPKVALQCHMDMVFVQKEGAGLDPLTAPITMKNDGKFLTSDGSTSLGADDGIGLAIALCIADGKASHGPLRLIVTTDEEAGMTGVQNLDPKYLSDIEFLVSIDAETEGEMCVSTASVDITSFTKEFEAAPQTKGKTFQIKIEGLTGGHSGLDIDKNRLNGGMEKGALLNAIKNEGIDFELKSLTAGTASNAIIPSATAEICVDEADAEKLQAIVGAFGDELKERGASTDSNATLTITEVAASDGFVLPASKKDAVLYFLSHFENGIKSMSPDIEGLVECSANLGIINIDATHFEAVAMSRSCSTERIKELLDGQRALAETVQFDVKIAHTGDAWAYKPDSKLEKLMRDSYQTLFGTDLDVIAVHAGLECGTFAIYNPELDMVAIGPTITDPHSIKEKLEIASIDKVWALLTDVILKVY